jgi:hypothetical protein
MTRKGSLSVRIAVWGVVFGNVLAFATAEARQKWGGESTPVSAGLYGQGNGTPQGGSDAERCQQCLAEDRRRFDECMEQARQYRREHLEGGQSGSLVLHSTMVGQCSSSPDVCREECDSIGR